MNCFRVRRMLLAVACAIAPVSKALSMDYTIDPGASKDNPAQHVWTSAQALADLKLAPGDRVLLKPGKYSASVVIRAQGTAENPVEIHFAPGEYDFHQQNAFKQKLQISNTNDDPQGDKAIAIAIVNSSHIRITGSVGTELFMHGKMMHVLIDHSQDITIDGLSFDYRRPTMSEYTVDSVADDHAILKIHPDSTYAVEDGKLFWVGEGWKYQAPGFSQQVIPSEGTTWRDKNPLAGATKIEELSKGVIKASFAKNPGFIAGRVFQHRQTRRDCSGAFVRNSQDIVWKNCKFYYLHGMGLVHQFTRNITLDHVDFTPRAGSGRTATCWADGVHLSGCAGKIVFNACNWSGMHDDPVNVHGTYLRVISQPAPDQVQVRFMHPQTYGFEAFFAGDEIQFVRGDSSRPFGQGKVKSAVLQDEKNMLLTLEQPLPDGIRPHDVIENMTWTPEVEIRKCSITMDSCRGLLLTTPRKIVVEDNVFLNTYMHAIHIEGNADGWFESGAVHDVLIRGNQFLKCNDSSINIAPGVTKNEGAVHENIRIESNYFQDNGKPAITATSVKGLVVTGNRFAQKTLPVVTHDCENVQTNDNALGATVQPRTK